MRLISTFAVPTTIFILVCQAQGGTRSKGSPDCDPFKLDSLIGTVSLSLGSDTAVKSVMPCLLRLWHENKNLGAVNFYVSNALLSVMEQNPHAFFSAMAGEARIFHEWLNEQDLSFTWSDDPPCGLEGKRKQLISILQHSRIAESNASAFKELAINKLSSIRCRQIDQALGLPEHLAETLPRYC